jgi:ABC-type Fe3+-citrate transport system substrate-binding protein
VQISEAVDKNQNLEAKLDQAHQLIEEWKAQLIHLQEKVIAMNEVCLKDLFIY